MGKSKASIIRFASVLIAVALVLTVPVAAQDDGRPTGGDDTPDAGSGLFNSFEKLEQLGLDILWYAGIVVVIFSAILFFTATKNADRAEYGKYGMMSGICAMGFAKLWPALVGLIEWVTA